MLKVLVLQEQSPLIMNNVFMWDYSFYYQYNYICVKACALDKQ